MLGRKSNRQNTGKIIENNAWLIWYFYRIIKGNMDKVKYSKEIKQIRKVLNDHEYTRTLSPGYHQFLSDMHRKMVSASNFIFIIFSPLGK